MTLQAYNEGDLKKNTTVSLASSVLPTKPDSELNNSSNQQASNLTDQQPKGSFDAANEDRAKINEIKWKIAALLKEQ